MNMETINNFSALQLYIGIDVHKKQWSVSIFTNAAHHRTFSQPPSPDALRTYVDKNFPHWSVICAYEATKLGYWIHRKLKAFGYECLVVNAADIPTSDKDATSKTDPVDSRKIAKALRANLLTSIHVPDIITEGDRQLFRYRKKLQADQTRVKNRIKDKFLFTGIQIPEQFDNANWSKAFLNWVRKAKLPDLSTRLTLDRLVEQYEFLHKHFLKVSVEVRKLQRESRYRKQAKLLRSIPGVGPLTTVELLCEIEAIERFKSFKKFNGFIGFRPYSHSSGEHDWKGRLTYRQHKALRSSLIECAWSAIQKDPIMAQRYNELKLRLTGKRAIVVIARKLTSRIYSVLKNGTPYQLGITN
jgi:transposase